jgi:glucose-1-phosphate thymidylyltransferase
MILGDNIFHGAGLGREISKVLPESGAHVFTYNVLDPSQYGVLILGRDGKPESVIEKPNEFVSTLALTGLYFFDARVCDLADQVVPSQRGELEVTSIISAYISKKELSFTTLSRGSAWLDTGNPSSLSDASTYVRVMEERTGLKIGCLEEVAWRLNLISSEKLQSLTESFKGSPYGHYLESLLRETHTREW